jgi:hypothetical protein
MYQAVLGNPVCKGRAICVRRWQALENLKRIPSSLSLAARFPRCYNSQRLLYYSECWLAPLGSAC